MKAPAILTIMMLTTLAVFAYAESLPRFGHRSSGNMFSRASVKQTCPLGSHYSSFYSDCTRTLTQVSSPHSH